MSEEATLKTAREVDCPHCRGSGKVALLAEIETVEVYYFGCRGEPGHYWWHSETRKGGRRDWDIEKIVSPKVQARIDGGFCHGAADPNDRLRRRTEPEVEGNAVLTWVDGWTVLAFWDRSVDRRGACNSNFVARGMLTYAEMRAVADAQFPSVTGRLKFEIRLVETRTA